MRRAVLLVMLLPLLGCSVTSIPSDGYKVTPVEGSECIQLERLNERDGDVSWRGLGIYCPEAK